jgi:hypothetical protein
VTDFSCDIASSRGTALELVRDNSHGAEMDSVVVRNPDTISAYHIYFTGHKALVLISEIKYKFKNKTSLLCCLWNFLPFLLGRVLSIISSRGWDV